MHGTIDSLYMPVTNARYERRLGRAITNTQFKSAVWEEPLRVPITNTPHKCPLRTPKVANDVVFVVYIYLCNDVMYVLFHGAQRQMHARCHLRIVASH